MESIKTYLDKIKNNLNVPKSLNTITTKLLMTFLFMTIIPLIVLAQFSTDLINSNMTQRAKSQLQLNIMIAQSKYNEELKNLRNLVVQGMSTSIEDAYKRYQTSKDYLTLSKNLESVIRKSEIDYLFIIDKNKNLIASANVARTGYRISSFSSVIDKVVYSGETISSTEIFKPEELEKEGGKLLRQSQIELESNDKTIIAGLSQIVALPIFNEYNHVEAIAISGKLLVKDNEIAESVGELTGATLMIGEILDFGGAVVIATNLTTTKGNRAIGKMISTDVVNTIYGLRVSQVREWQIREYQIANYYPLTGVDGNIVGLVYLGIPEKQFTMLAEQNVWLVGVISIIGLFSAILLSAIFSRSITTPILKLSDAANRISQGDLGIRVNVKGSYEIAQMGEAFNMMAANLQKEERLRDDFVATLTHDLKVPLLAENQTINYMIKGSYGEVNEEQKEVLEIVKNTNESTLDMVNTLLEVYRYDAGKNILLKADVDIRSLIKNSVLALTPLAEDKNIVININLPDEEIITSIDEREIKRVIHNIVANAISSTLRRGTITVSVEACKEKRYYGAEDKEYSLTTLSERLKLQHKVLVNIYDTGIGMEKEDMENLFKRFSGNKGRKPSSTGLGLYYSHQVISAHGGEIWAESQEGEGSVFKFTLPLVKK